MNLIVIIYEGIINMAAQVLIQFRVDKELK